MSCKICLRKGSAVDMAMPSLTGHSDAQQISYKPVHNIWVSAQARLVWAHGLLFQQLQLELHTCRSIVTDKYFCVKGRNGTICHGNSVPVLLRLLHLLLLLLLVLHPLLLLLDLQFFTQVNSNR